MSKMKIAIQGELGAYSHIAVEKLYKNACLIERGSFRPVTQVNLDMLENAKSQFVTREDVEEENVEVFMDYLVLMELENEL